MLATVAEQLHPYGWIITLACALVFMACAVAFIICVPIFIGRIGHPAKREKATPEFAVDNDSGKRIHVTYVSTNDYNDYLN